MKSSFCNTGTCIDVTKQGDTVCLLNTSPESRSYVVSCTREEWEDFVKGVKNGEFDFDKLEVL